MSFIYSANSTPVRNLIFRQQLRIKNPQTPGTIDQLIAITPRVNHPIHPYSTALFPMLYNSRFRGSYFLCEEEI